MKTVATALIEKNPLFREGLKSLLSETNFRIMEAHCVPELAQAADGNNSDIGLAIAGIDDDFEDPEEFLGEIRERYPLCHIVVLSSSTDMHFIRSCFSAGADGYFTRDVSPSSLLNSLSMVMADEKICPTFVLTALTETRREDRRTSSNADLSGREMEILRHLAIGETNKQIAIRQNITEATVKVHVKAILRKLSLSNRTQAAVWAHNEGIMGRSAQTRHAMV